MCMSYRWGLLKNSVTPDKIKALTHSLTPQMQCFAESLIKNSRHSYGYDRKHESKKHKFSHTPSTSWTEEQRKQSVPALCVSLTVFTVSDYCTCLSFLINLSLHSQHIDKWF